MSASGPGEAWAVGTFLNTKGLDQPLVEHRNATAWTRVSVPVPGGQQAILSGVDDLGPADAWAVGTSFSGGIEANPAVQTLTEQFSGKTWTVVPSPDPGEDSLKLKDNALASIASAGGSNLFAVGSRTMNGQSVIRTLAIATTQG